MCTTIFFYLAAKNVDATVLEAVAGNGLGLAHGAGSPGSESLR